VERLAPDLRPRSHALLGAYLHSVRFGTATTDSWLSPTLYGETIVWDGHKLQRYPARLKD
jgi:hypothetical protein